MERYRLKLFIIQNNRLIYSQPYAVKKKLDGGGIILSGHTDVVPASAKEWSSDPFVAREKDNKVYGRGSCDMKGFIACTLVLAPFFASQNLKKPIHFSFTYDEETACQGAPIMLKN